MPMAPPTEGGSGKILVPPPQAPVQTPAGDIPASGAIIPNAGVYGAESAAALNAYNNAVAQATSSRNALYHSYGLINDGSVDPNNPEGQYQQMLGQQADQFQADNEDAAGRGIRGGLAHKAESHDRRGALAQDFQFQQQVAGAGSDYQNALQSALDNKQSAMSTAYNDALNAALAAQIDAMSGGTYTAPDTGATQDVTPPPKADKVAKAKKALAKHSAASRHHHSRG